MKNIAVSIALVAILALGVAATVSASSRSNTKPAACDRSASCDVQSVADCGDCPPECQPCCEPCAPSGAAAAAK